MPAVAAVALLMMYLLELELVAEVTVQKLMLVMQLQEVQILAAVVVAVLTSALVEVVQTAVQVL